MVARVGGRRAWALDADSPSPPSLEIGRGVPDHWRREEISLDVAEDKTLCFQPMCLYSLYSEISRRIR